ncbi:MAG: AEC family transporter, partial [Spirochaetales bacterium]
LGFLACRMFGLGGKTALVFIVGSALPSAVFSYIITRRYGADASFAGSMILVSTCLSILTLPLTFWAAERVLGL